MKKYQETIAEKIAKSCKKTVGKELLIINIEETGNTFRSVGGILTGMGIILSSITTALNNKRK